MNDKLALGWILYNSESKIINILPVRTARTGANEASSPLIQALPHA